MPEPVSPSSSLIELPFPEGRRVLPFLAPHHELSVASVIEGTLPGQIWAVPDLSCGLIQTPECHLLWGTPSDAAPALFQKVGLFDPVTGDRDLWGPVIEAHHPNSAIRRYTRCSLTLHRGEERRGSSGPRVLRYGDFRSIEYTNKDLVLDWIQTAHPSLPADLPVAAVIVEGNRIVSCSALDCVSGRHAELGVKTVPEARKRGYGKACVAALVRELFAHGFDQIGWHCVATNRGSLRIAEALGFSRRTDYDSYSPFPPIENDDDLSAAQWAEYARFFEQKAAENPDHHWQAARCWAQASEPVAVLGCVSALVATRRLWFRDFLGDSPLVAAALETEEGRALLRNLP